MGRQRKQTKPEKSTVPSLAAILARYKVGEETQSADTERRKEDNKLRLKIHKKKSKNTDKRKEDNKLKLKIHKEKSKNTDNYYYNTSIAPFSPVSKTLKSRYGDKQMHHSLATLMARHKTRREAHSVITERRKKGIKLKFKLRKKKFEHTDYSVIPRLHEKHLMERERMNRTITVNPAAAGYTPLRGRDGVGIEPRPNTSPVRNNLPVLKASRKHVPGTEYSVARSKKARQKRRLTDSRSRVERKVYGSTIARSKSLYDNEERGWTVAGKKKVRRERIALYKLRREAATMIQKHYRGMAQRVAYQMELERVALHKLRRESATMIQKHYRGMAQRVAYQRELNKELLAVELMQAVFRRYSDRVKYLALLALRERSAIKIQAEVRASQQRVAYAALLEKRRVMACKIQAQARGRQQRLRFAAIVEDRRISAEIIQKAYRLHRWYEARKAAITTIQTQYRGSVRRYQYRQLLQRRFDAASLLQARARGRAQRKRYREIARRREAGSILLQRHWRGRMQRDRFVVMRQRHGAAIRVQAQWRAKMARKWYKKQDAARTIQKNFRGYRVRLTNKRSTAACKIQSQFRGKVARTWYKREKAAIKMQAQYRGHMQARRYNERKAATVIQKHLRGKQARERVKRERASMRIQAQYRGSVSRQKYKEHQSSVLLQRNIRGMQARAHYAPLRNAKRKAATGMQKSWRMFHQRRKHRQHLAARKRGVVIMQKSWRGKAARIKTAALAITFSAVTRLQSVWRSHHSRDHTRLRKLLLGNKVFRRTAQAFAKQVVLHYRGREEKVFEFLYNRYGTELQFDFASMAQQSKRFRTAHAQRQDLLEDLEEIETELAIMKRDGNDDAAEATGDDKAGGGSDNKSESKEALLSDLNIVKDKLFVNEREWRTSVKALRPFHDKLGAAIVEYMLEHSPSQILRGVAAMVIQKHVRSFTLRYAKHRQLCFPVGTPVWVNTRDAVSKSTSWARGTVTTEPQSDRDKDTTVGVVVTYDRLDSEGTVESLNKPVELPRDALVRRFDFLRSSTGATDDPGNSPPATLKNQEFLTRVKVLTLTTRTALLDRKHKARRRTAADSARLLMWQEAVVIGGTVVDVPLKNNDAAHYSIDSAKEKLLHQYREEAAPPAKDLLLDVLVFNTGNIINAVPWKRLHVVQPSPASKHSESPRQVLEDLQDLIMEASKAGNGSDILKHVNRIYRSNFSECHDIPAVVRFPLQDGDVLGDLTAVAFDANDRDGNSPLHVSVADQHLAATRVLIGLGIDTNPPPVELDVEDLNDDIADELDMPDPPCPFNIVTPLLSAIALGDAALVAALLESDTPPLMTGKELSLDSGALYLAALRCEPDIVQLLLEHGADPNEQVAQEWQAQSGWTALHLAASENLIDVVTALCKHPDCNVDQVNIDGSTPLMMCVAKGMANMTGHLLGEKADPNIVDVDDVAPLEVAVSQSDVTLVKILLRAGAKHDQGVLQGFNLVSLAAFTADFDIMAILAEYGADLDHCNEDGENCVALLQHVHGLTWDSALRVDADCDAELPDPDSGEWTEEAREWFRKMDTDDSEFIDNSEFRDYMQRFGLQNLYGKYFDKMIDLEFLKLDRSNKSDGTITFPEFQNCLWRFLRLRLFGQARYNAAIKIQAVVRGVAERRALGRKRQMEGSDSKILKATYTFSRFEVEVKPRAAAAAADASADPTKPTDTSVDSTEPAEAAKTSGATVEATAPSKQLQHFDSEDSVLTDSDEEWSEDDHEEDSLDGGATATGLVTSEHDKKDEIVVQELAAAGDDASVKTPQLNSSN